MLKCSKKQIKSQILNICLEYKENRIIIMVIILVVLNTVINIHIILRIKLFKMNQNIHIQAL